jgi:TRAP-type mannitol/chloroaromatic compound transport system permease small subunit
MSDTAATPSPRPSRLARAIGAIERLNERAARAAAWLVLVMVLVGAGNAVVRWLGRSIGMSLASNAAIELQWYLFGVIFLFAGAWAIAVDAHVRIDVVSSRLSSRARTWIELAGTLVFLLPFALFVVVASWPSVASSWRVREGSPDPGGLPRWPLKALVPLAFLLVIAQGAARAASLVRLVAASDGGPGRDETNR